MHTGLPDIEDMGVTIAVNVDAALVYSGRMMDAMHALEVTGLIFIFR